MSAPDANTALHSYLQRSRDALVWKLDGLTERQAREPRTPTGTNLLGLIKHALNVEAGYFGSTFGREFPEPDELVALAAYDSDPQVDFYATEDESMAYLVDLYRRVWAFSDETIESLPLDAPGVVAWWLPQARDVTLQEVIVHVITDLARHAGHADILREQIDGAAGLAIGRENLPDVDWPAYVARLTDLAARFP